MAFTPTGYQKTRRAAQTLTRVLRSTLLAHETTTMLKQPVPCEQVQAWAVLMRQFHYQDDAEALITDHRELTGCTDPHTMPGTPLYGGHGKIPTARATYDVIEAFVAAWDKDDFAVRFNSPEFGTLTCPEADALAHVFRCTDRTETADRMLATHAATDSKGDKHWKESA